MKNESTTRRRFLQLAAASSLAAGTSLPPESAQAEGSTRAKQPPPAARIADQIIAIEFNASMRLRVRYTTTQLGPWSTSDYLLLANGARVEEFQLQAHELIVVNDVHGAGRRLTLRGSAPNGIEKTLEVTLFDRYPGIAFYQAHYRNLSPGTVKVKGWNLAGLEISRGAAEQGHPPFWSYCGSTHEDRRDWIQPLQAGFSQDNFMGMSASDYGGGTPVVDVWRRDVGVALGHVERNPKIVSLPVSCTHSGATMAVTAARTLLLAPQATLDTVQAFIAVHSGDYFAALDGYRRVMADRGIQFPHPPPAAYEPIWCAWGYERSCSVELIEKTLPKVKELGLRWAVVDDGWQSNVGDWKLSPVKFARGEADMKQLVGSIEAHSLKARLWFAPLAAAPGSDLLHDHSEMLLLDKDGAPQLVSWWNSFYLCPAHAPTVAYTNELVRRFIGEWGFAGLKIDGQHLNGVAPCFNPTHGHAYPEESVEKLPDFLHEIYKTAMDINPNAVIEVCPCGTSYSLFNFPAMNQAPASDPESSWQVRHKGKTLKALMGPGAAFAGDHVELSDGGKDFASTVGIGAIVSTKFTWPVDPKPKDSFLLTPAMEPLWRRWIALYNQNMLPLGNYRGNLYDIGFDRPEGHVIEKDGRLFYAFYARDYEGEVPLRGLSAPRYRLRDYFNERELGEVSPSRNRVRLSFEHFLVLEATPV
jgi:alpha-galactosidase